MTKVVWLVRGFKDYRIPLFNTLAATEGIEFYLIFNSDITNNSIYSKLNFGESGQVRLKNEISIGPKDNNYQFGNKSFRIPIQKDLLKTLRDIQPDVIIGEGFFQWTFYAYLYKLIKKNVKIVVSYERTKHTERNVQLLRTIYRKIVLKFTHAIVCNGILSKEYIESLGYGGRVLMGNMSVDVLGINKKTRDSNSQIDNKKPIHFLYLGLLTERKGILQLLEIWKKYENLFPDEIELTLIGTGNLEQDIERFLQNKQMKTVKMIGPLPYEEVVEYFTKVDILINPTLEDNWSLVVPEAMAAELPIITTIYNGLYPELVKKRNGWVIDILDEHHTLQALQEVIMKKEFLKQMGKESFKIIKQYTPERISENYKAAIFQ